MLYVYIGCLSFGVVYALVSAVLGGHGFDHGVDGHGGLDGHGGDTADMPSPLNPLVLASAIATFGAVGIISKLGFSMGDMASSILSLGFAGLVGAAVFFGVVRLMYNSQSNSLYSQEELIGIMAEVITPLPEKGLGEIACSINGMRYTYTARSVNGSPISRGEMVCIRNIAGNIAEVAPKVSIEDMETLENSHQGWDQKDSNQKVKGEEN